MGIVIEILVKLLARTAVTAVVGGLSFLGYNIGDKLPQATTTPETQSVFPIIVDLGETTSISTPTTTPSALVTPTTTVAKTAVKPPKKTTPAVQPATNTPVTTRTETQQPPKITTSLSDLPIPSIELPTASQIASGVDFGIFNDAYSIAEQSVVNILCISQKGNIVTVSTGSGVIIDPQGIIITNAHVAETLLIPGQDCTIRQGSIAEDKYKATLVYINDAWLSKNAGVIFTENARGTGENDFALLAITEGVNGKTLPSVFSYATPSLQELGENNKNNSILAAGYPGGTLGALSLRKYLAFVADTTVISNVFTLTGPTTDIIETEATNVGQRGASGGGIFSPNGELIGLIDSTQGNGNVEKINALTLPYVNRSFKNLTGKTLREFISIHKLSLIADFAEKQPALYDYVKPYLNN